MALNDAGIAAFLDDGNEAVVYVALGDGTASTDQVSAERVLLTSSVAAGVVTATGVPYEFTGTASASVTHALLFSAAGGGTFYGYESLTGDGTFSGDGAYNLTALTITGSSDSLPAAGLTALLNDGNDAAFYVAIGDGDTSVDQTSTARVLVTWDAAVVDTINANGLPYAFTGTPNAGATHALLYSAPTGGTFYGALELAGDQTFSTLGGYNLTALSLTGSTTPLVPSEPYERGIHVGVPVGTTLTDRAVLGSPTATETYVITHPVTGVTNTLDVSVWRNIRFTSTIPLKPDSGATFLFDGCSFEGQGNWCVEVDGTNHTLDIMEPLVVFDRCNFDGGSLGGTSKCMLGGYSWVIDSDMRGSEDGWAGWFYNVGIRSNFLGFGFTIDQHSDGVQCTDIGVSAFSQCFFQTTGPGASQSFRVGTEAGATTNVLVQYSGFDGGGYAVQFRGDSGAGDITSVTVNGCRWTRAHEFGPIDVSETTGITWENNAYFDGEVIEAP